jgi:hypothetical protein
MATSSSTSTSKTNPSLTAKDKALKNKVGEKVKSAPREKSEAELDHEKMVKENERMKRGL